MDMDRKEFRKALLAVKLDAPASYGLHGHVPGYKSALYLHLTGKRDRLAARCGASTPDARSRIKHYPLFVA
jgi:hypothetical protein